MAALSRNGIGSKDKLIAATIELISCKGFENTGINEILDKAQVTKSNFYYHFKSKEELCLSALDGIADYFFDNVIDSTLLNKSLDPRTRLAKFIRTIIDEMDKKRCKNGCPFINVGNETCDFYPSFRKKMVYIYDRYTQAIGDCYFAGVEQGDFREDFDAETIADFILSEINGTIILSKVRKSTKIFERNLNTLLLMLSP